MGKKQQKTSKDCIECFDSGFLENVNLTFGPVDRHRISRSFRTTISLCLWISSENRFYFVKFSLLS